MRILYVLERYPELSQTFVSAEIRGLLELGAKVEVLALRRGDRGESPAAASWAEDASASRRIRSSLVAMIRAPGAVLGQLAREPNWPPPRGSRRLRGLARISPWYSQACNFDHVHAHFATEAADIARLTAAAAGLPWSFTAHGTDSYAPCEQLAVNLESASFARAIAPHVRDQLLKCAPALPERLALVPAAISEDRFASVVPYQENGPVVAVGRLVEKKGFDDLIKAAAQSHDALAGRKVLIAGEGPERGRLQDLITSLDAPVKLLGAVANQDLPQLLCTASVFAAPSKLASDGDRDGRPTAIAEAMCAGLPVLSTTMPGIPELVDSGHGVLVAPGDPGQLADGLRWLVSQPGATRAAIGRSGSRHAIEMHGHLRVARQMLDLFKGRQA